MDLLTRHLTQKAEKIVERAAALAVMEERSTLQQRDMERAIEEEQGCANVLTADRSAPCGATTYNTNAVEIEALDRRQAARPN